MLVASLRGRLRWRNLSISSTRTLLNQFSAPVRKFGAARAQAVCCRLLGRPLRGRWGSARASEQFLQRASMAEVRVVFPLAIRSLIAGACTDDGDDVGQLDVEEGYSQKRYTWAKECNAGLQTYEFGARKETCIISRAPLEEGHDICR